MPPTTRAAAHRDGRRLRRRRGRLGRVLFWLAGAGVIGVLGLWIAVNRVAWLGPYVADGLRAVVGVDAVASLEDFAYRLQDRVNRVVRRGERPQAHWQVPAAPPKVALPALPEKAAEDGNKAEAVPPFRLADVGPVHKEWSAPGDGTWVPMVDEKHGADSPYMLKTLLHPDKNRSWAEVFVVAIDLRRARLHLVAGTKEPAATEDAALSMPRAGVVPAEARDSVLAAFNGGFKTEHGQYGMFVDGTLLVKPKPGVCAIAAYKDDSVRIATWNVLEDSAPQMTFWRETPVCMYENDKLHFRLADPTLAKKWGATLDGETVIRRSAIGIDKTGQVLFVSISNHTTARVIADGVHHAGATTVAQLDVNFSYPKFVTFEQKKNLDSGETPKRIAIPLADGFEFSEDEYIREPARRDFFYLMPKDEDVRTALKAKSD
jgi:hypothetical protein